MRQFPDLILPQAIPPHFGFVLNANGFAADGRNLGFRTEIAMDSSQIGNKLGNVIVGVGGEMSDSVYAVLCTMLTDMGDIDKWIVTKEDCIRWGADVTVDNGMLELTVTAIAMPYADPRPAALVNYLVGEGMKYGYVPIAGLVDPDLFGRIVDEVTSSEGVHITRLYPEGDNSWEMTNWFEAITDPDETISLTIGYVGVLDDEAVYITGHWMTKEDVAAEVHIGAYGPETITVKALGTKRDIFETINLTSDRMNLISVDQGASLESEEALKGVDHD